MHDVIVIGLGAVGSAVTWQLARRGARVLGLDRFHPPHEHGSSHGRTRITRLAVGEGGAFVPLVQRSHRLWREIEAETGEVLLRRTGLLTIATAEPAREAFHGSTGFFEQTVALARRFGIVHELLDAGELARRHPAFLPAGDERAYFEPDAGVLDPERCVAAQLALAGRAGAQLHFGEPVLRVGAGGTGVRVETTQGVRHAAQAVLCAGAWLPALAGEPFVQHLVVRRQVLHWWHCDEPALYEPARCPAFIWIHGRGAGDALYGFPLGDGVAGVKVAAENVDQACDPDTVRRDVGDDEVRATYRQHLQGRLRGLTPHAVQSKTCLYTCTDDANFVVDRHPRLPALWVASPCSGHGFKHSAALGEALAQRLLGDTAALNLGPFGLRAPAAG